MSVICYSLFEHAIYPQVARHFRKQLAIFRQQLVIFTLGLTIFVLEAHFICFNLAIFDLSVFGPVARHYCLDLAIFAPIVHHFPLEHAQFAPGAYHFS